MASYAEIRKQRGDSAERMQNQINDLNEKSGSGSNPQIEDESYLDLSHVRGKEGTGYVILRWLPAPEDEDKEFVHFYEYIFNGPGGWYVQKGRNSLGKDYKDPVKEFNDKIFRDNTLTKEERMKRLLGRKESYVSNVLVVKDPNKPENEGKVFRFKYGNQIFKMLEAAQFPKALIDIEGEPVRKIDVWDPIEGANFHLIVTTKSDGTKTFPSYETSKFASKNTSIVNNVEDFDAIWKRQYSLEELVKESAFKSYEELVKEFNRAMGYDEGVMSSTPSTPTPSPKNSASNSIPEDKSDPVDEIPDFNNSSTPASSDAGSDDDWFDRIKNS